MGECLCAAGNEFNLDARWLQTVKVAFYRDLSFCLDHSQNYFYEW